MPITRVGEPSQKNDGPNYIQPNPDGSINVGSYLKTTGSVYHKEDNGEAIASWMNGLSDIIESDVCYGGNAGSVVAMVRTL